MAAKITDKLMLLVEDEPALFNGIQAWLRDNEHGFAVISTSDGKKARELLSGEGTEAWVNIFSAGISHP